MVFSIGSAGQAPRCTSVSARHLSHKSQRADRVPADPRCLRAPSNSQSSATEAVLNVPLFCRVRGQWRIRLFGLSNHALACCICLSHRRRHPRALTHCRPETTAPGEDGRGERAQGTRGFENGPPSGSLGCGPCHVGTCVHRRRLGRQPLLVEAACDPALHPAPDSTCSRCLGPGALRHPANPAATVLQERDELAFGLRITSM